MKLMRQTFSPDETLWAQAKHLSEREGKLLSAWVAEAVEQYTYQPLRLKMSGEYSPVPRGLRTPKQAQFTYPDHLYAAAKGAAIRSGVTFNSYLETALACKVIKSIGNDKFKALYRRDT